MLCVSSALARVSLRLPNLWGLLEVVVIALRPAGSFPFVTLMGKYRCGLQESIPLNLALFEI